MSRTLNARNAMFMIRILVRAIQIQKYVALMFYRLIWQGSISVIRKTRSIRKGCENNPLLIQLVSIRTENAKSKIEMYVRKGCLFSPDLINVYIDVILRELEIIP